MNFFRGLSCTQATTAQEESSRQAKYSVGTDMGAACSGYAFIKLEGSYEEVHQVSDYFQDSRSTPEGGHQLDTNTAKTMTAILYQKHLLRGWEPVDWGSRAYVTYQNMPLSKRCNFELFEDFKMALANEDERRRFMLQMRPDCDLSLERIIADFLTFIRKHAVQSLGVHYKDRAVVAGDVLWTITVPADWSSKAQEIMRQAAVKAGMVANMDDSRLEVISEPEAAAQSCSHQGSIQRSMSGATFMVLDAGGATTDITVHHVSEDGHLEDPVYTSGIFSGSKHIDRKFEEWLAGLVGQEVFHQWKRDDPAAYLELMHGVWALAKVEYVGDGNGTQYIINLDDARLTKRIPQATKDSLVASRIITGYSKNAIILHQAQIGSFFAGVVEKALDLVQNSISEAGQVPEKILLVGGLGSSPCLLHALQDLVRREQWSTEVIMPVHGLTAVVQGATMFPKLNETGGYKKAGHGYGLWLPWRLHSDKALQGATDQARLNMIWRPMITVGEYVQIQMKPKQFATTRVHMDAGSLTASFSIYKTADRNPVYGPTTQGECIGTLDVDMAAGQAGTGPSKVAHQDLQFWYKLGRKKVTVSATTSTGCKGLFVFSIE